MELTLVSQEEIEEERVKNAGGVEEPVFHLKSPHHDILRIRLQHAVRPDKPDC
jgi:hypothetical protein